ncbi:TIGR04438 family Trp-rich protein [Glaciimonas sp. GG7]
MPLILIIVLFVALKYFAIGPFVNLSWWWLAGLMAIAFIWFECVERILGLDKRRTHNKMDKIRAERIRKTFDTHNRPGHK